MRVRLLEPERQHREREERQVRHRHVLPEAAHHEVREEREHRHAALLRDARTAAATASGA